MVIRLLVFTLFVSSLLNLLCSTSATAEDFHGYYVEDSPPAAQVEIGFRELPINRGHLGCRLNRRGRVLPAFIFDNRRNTPLRQRVRRRVNILRASGATIQRIRQARRRVRQRLNIPQYRTFCQIVLSSPHNFVPAPGQSLPAPELPAKTEEGQTQCEAADFNNDGEVNKPDLIALLKSWGQSGSPYDLNGDGVVDIHDLILLLFLWGPVDDCELGSSDPLWQQLIDAGVIHPIYSIEDALRRNLGPEEYRDILERKSPGHAIGPNGWTKIVPLTNAENPEDNTRLIYLDPDNGDDDTAEVYQVDGQGNYPSFIGSDPENPADPGVIKAFATAGQAYEASRGGPALGAGKPDWILVKRGTIVPDRFGRHAGTGARWQRSGLSENHRFVVTTYGEGSRPIFDYHGSMFVVQGGGGSADKYENVFVRGLDMRLRVKDQSDPQFDLGFTIRAGTQWTRRVVNWRWEDCAFNGRSFMSQHDGGNIHFRRCSWKNVYDVGRGGHTLSVFASDSGTSESDEGGPLIFDECTFTGGGWDRFLTESMAGGTSKTNMAREPHYAELAHGVLADWQAITNGSFEFFQGYQMSSSGSWHQVTGVDFSAATNLHDVATIIELAMGAASGEPNKVHYSTFSTAAGSHHVLVFNVDGSTTHVSGIRDIENPPGTPIGNGTWLSKRRDDHDMEELAQIPTDNIHERNIYVRSHPFVLVRGSIDDSSTSDLQLGFGNMYRTAVLRASHGGFSWGSNGNRSKVNYNLFMHIRQPWAMSNRGWAWTYNDPGAGGEFIGNIATQKDASAGSREAWSISTSSPGDPGDGKMKAWRENIAYNWGRGLNLNDSDGDLAGFTVEDDIYHDTAYNRHIVRAYNLSDVLKMNFKNVTWYSQQTNANEQFQIESTKGNFSWWQTQADDQGSNNNPAAFSDPERDVVSYLTSIGEPGNIDDFVERALNNNMGSWDERYTATALINHIRSGFDRDEVPAGIKHEVIPSVGKLNY